MKVVPNISIYLHNFSPDFPITLAILPEPISETIFVEIKKNAGTAYHHLLALLLAGASPNGNAALLPPQQLA
jgi:hypothetical protein